MSATLPTKEQALQAQSFMIDQIHVPAFLEKLASHGVAPKTRGEVQQLVQLGAMLAQAETEGRVKSAQDQGNPFLTHVMQRLTPRPVQDIDAMVKANADAMISQHEVAKNAALIYGHTVAGGELAE